jgi:hypothetical protein
MTEQEQPEPEPGEEAGEDVAAEKEAHVRVVAGNWHLVEYGTWQVSVGPDGLLMLPRYVHPREINDFVGAMLAAAEVGEKVVRENQENATELGEITDAPTVITEGAPPPGYVPLVISARSEQEAAATIGRPKRRERPQPARGIDPRQPRNTRQRPPIGVRDGQ